jgi:hypothetical protein
MISVSLFILRGFTFFLKREKLSSGITNKYDFDLRNYIRVDFLSK